MRFRHRSVRFGLLGLGWVVACGGDGASPAAVPGGGGMSTSDSGAAPDAGNSVPDLCQLSEFAGAWGSPGGSTSSGPLHLTLWITFCASSLDIQVTGARLDGAPLTVTAQWFCGCNGSDFSTCSGDPASGCASGQPMMVHFAETVDANSSQLELDLMLRGQPVTVRVPKGTNHLFDASCTRTEATCTTCTPVDCTGRECGSDHCGGTCGPPCVTGTCTGTGHCTEAPQTCSGCLSSCSGLSSCCTGCGCICEAACGGCI